MRPCRAVDDEACSGELLAASSEEVVDELLTFGLWIDSTGVVSDRRTLH
jgi:hypothetical protein